MKIAVLGAGAAGTAITRFLVNEKIVTSVNVIDRNGNALDTLDTQLNSNKIRVHRVGMEKELAVYGLIKTSDCVISALPYKQNYKVASLAIKAGKPYVDLGGDDDTLERQLSLHEKAREINVNLIPNAGFAPGLVNILAMHGYNSLDKVDSIIIRAAALPKYPKPPLNYHLSFSPVGLINEYLHKVALIEDGEYQEFEALDGYELCKLKSRPELGELEAFYTSGSSTALARHLVGKVNTFNFKTLRYVGHRNIIKSFFDLGFNSNQIIDIRTSLTYRNLLIRQLRKFLPQSNEDIAVAKIICKGVRDGMEVTREYEVNLESGAEEEISAMMKCTAISAVVTALLLAEGKIESVGGVFVPELAVPGDEFIKRMQEHGIDITITEN